MNITVHQLRIFLKVVGSQSITKAAEELHITQPAVSIQLKNLQDQFDIPLLEVIGRKVFISDFGKEVAVAAENLIEVMDSIESKAAAYKGLITGKLKISVVSTGKYIIPYFLSDFIEQNKDIELILDVTNRSKVIKSLENNEIDFALLSILPDKMALNQIELMDNDLYLVGNRLEEIKTQEEYYSYFMDRNLIFREPGSGTRSIMELFIKQHSLQVNNKMELTSNEAVKQAVIAGLGNSILPLIGMRNEINSGVLQIIPLNGFPIKSKWRLVYLKNKKLSPVATAFKDYIIHEKERIISKNF